MKETFKDKIENFFEDIRDKIKTIYNNIYNGISNLYRWFPIIYRDRNWDSFYIYEILKTKLEFQAKYIGDKDRHTRAKRDAELMRTCARLIENCQKEKYGLEWMDFRESSINWVDPEDEDLRNKGLVQLEIDVKNENYQDYINFNPLTHKKVLKYLEENPKNYRSPESKEIQCMLVSKFKQDKCRKILFELLNTHIEGFWD